MRPLLVMLLSVSLIAMPLRAGSLGSCCGSDVSHASSQTEPAASCCCAEAGEGEQDRADQAQTPPPGDSRCPPGKCNCPAFCCAKTAAYVAPFGLAHARTNELPVLATAPAAKTPLGDGHLRSLKRPPRV